jgi:hypothetical protein
MRITLASLLWIVLALLILQDQLWMAAVAAGMFTLYFGAVAVVVLAILIDAYFGAFAGVPYLSVVAVVWYVGSELLRQRMRIIE